MLNLDSFNEVSTALNQTALVLCSSSVNFFFKFCQPEDACTVFAIFNPELTQFISDK